MDVTLDGIVIDVRFVQKAKAEPPIDVTLEGMVIEVRPLQPEKAQPTIDVTLEGMTVFLHPAISAFVDVSIIQLRPFPSL